MKNKIQLLEYYYIVKRKYFFTIFIVYVLTTMLIRLVNFYQKFRKHQFFKKLKISFLYFSEYIDYFFTRNILISFEILSFCLEVKNLQTLFLTPVDPSTNN